VRRVEEMWGTVISVDVRDAVDAAVIDECFEWFRRVDDLFSTWKPDTEIMRIGRNELRVEDASPEVQEVLARCDEMRVETGGAFDIAFGARIPGAPRLDPSGLVKGWAVARAADRLATAGATCFCVNAGGDVLTRGRPAGSDGWRVGIQHPWERNRVASVLSVDDAAVATSGLYERGMHVLDPRTGVPARELASVTVVGADLTVADAYATATVVLGASEGMRWLATRAGYEGMAIAEGRTVVLTPGFDRYRVS
jgi:thiamine biosynthesis lipoprotein